MKYRNKYYLQLFIYRCDGKQNRSKCSNQTSRMEKTVLPKTFSAGPHGLGDPEDRTLRKVEIEIMVPKIMREKAKSEKCTQEVKDFTDCCRDSSLAMVFTCRKENSRLKECLTHWYADAGFRSECTEEYLRERSEYRRTGILKKHRDFIKSSGS